MNRFEKTVIATLITNVEQQLAALKTIVAASSQDGVEPARVTKKPNYYDQDFDLTTEEDDKLIEEMLHDQTVVESDTLGKVWQEQQKEIDAHGNEGRREG